MFEILHDSRAEDSGACSRQAESVDQGENVRRPEPQEFVELTDEQIASYLEDGYLALDQIASAEEVVRLRAIYDRLFTARAGREAGDQLDLAGVDDDSEDARLPQIVEPDKYAPELAEGRYRANALAIAQQLLGAGVEYAGEHAIFKPAHVGPRRHGTRTSRTGTRSTTTRSRSGSRSSLPRGRCTTRDPIARTNLGGLTSSSIAPRRHRARRVVDSRGTKRSGRHDSSGRSARRRESDDLGTMGSRRHDGGLGGEHLRAGGDRVARIPVHPADA